MEEEWEPQDRAEELEDLVASFFTRKTIQKALLNSIQNGDFGSTALDICGKHWNTFADLHEAVYLSLEKNLRSGLDDVASDLTDAFEKYVEANPVEEEEDENNE